jgi:hypothetical protein
MTVDRNHMTCEEFQDQLPELIGSGADASLHPHVQNCALCHTLLSDLQTIADAARQLFPVEDPSDSLWEKLETAIKQEGDPGRG